MSVGDLIVVVLTTVVVSLLFGAHRSGWRVCGLPGALVFAIPVVVLGTFLSAVVVNWLRLDDGEAFVVAAVSGTTTALSIGVGSTRAARRRRRPGARRVRLPFYAFGVVSMFVVPLGMGVVFVASGFDGMIESRIHVLIAPAVVLSSLFFSAALRQVKSKVDAGAVVREGAVVYIRGFTRQRERFAATSMRHDDNEALGITYQPHRLRRGTATFEEFLEPTARTELGEWQCLGDLTDYLPPLGGVHIYTSDGRWREEFAALVGGSRCVLTFPHSYRQLRYELSVIRKAGAHERFFVLTPPLRYPNSARRVAEDRELQRKRWAEFAAEAALPFEGSGLLGYTPVPDPGPGAVVAFDAEAKAVVLRRDAATPADFVSAIKAHLDAVPERPAA